MLYEVITDVKRPGDLVYVLGVTRDELGGSEYYAMRGEVGVITSYSIHYTKLYDRWPGRCPNGAGDHP